MRPPRLRSRLGALALLAAAAACGFVERSLDSTSSQTPPSDRLVWKTLASAPSRRTEVAATVVQQDVYVVGGFGPGGATVSTVEVYRAGAGRWERGPDLPAPVNHAMAATLGGEPLLLGGYLGPSLERPSDRAFVLRGGRWAELPRMPEARAAAGAATIGRSFYLAGGVGMDGLARSVLEFDGVRWRVRSELPHPREHLGVATDGSRLYVVGGRTPAGNLAIAERFDPADGRWETLPDLPTARGGIGAAGTGDGRFIVVPGGEAQSTFEEVEAFDVRAGRWRSLPPLPTPRHGLGVVAIGSTIYVLAGGPQPGFSFSDANEALDLAPLTQD